MTPYGKSTDFGKGLAVNKPKNYIVCFGYRIRSGYFVCALIVVVTTLVVGHVFHHNYLAIFGDVFSVPVAERLFRRIEKLLGDV